jgi:4-hydroxy-tetrahydrodipicolinate synthase
MKIEGIIPPIVTPMKEDQSIDLPGLRSQIDRQIAAGVDGIFVLGTTGEFYALDRDEKQAIMAEAVQHIAGRVPVYAGTGAATTHEVLALNRLAEKEKIQAVSVITPYYINPTQAEIANHYRIIASETSLPILLYSNPAMGGGIKIDLETVAKLSELSNIVGIKDSSGDLTHLIELVRISKPGFSVLQGRDTLIYSGLEVGAKGAIPATCNIAPQFPVGIYQAMRSGNSHKAWEFQQKLAPVRLAMTFGTPPGSVKTAMNLLGQSVGPSRSPLKQMSEENRMKLRKILTEAGLI